MPTTRRPKTKPKSNATQVAPNQVDISRAGSGGLMGSAARECVAAAASSVNTDAATAKSLFQLLPKARALRAARRERNLGQEYTQEQMIEQDKRQRPLLPGSHSSLVMESRTKMSWQRSSAVTRIECRVQAGLPRSKRRSSLFSKSELVSCQKQEAHGKEEVQSKPTACSSDEILLQMEEAARRRPIAKKEG